MIDISIVIVSWNGKEYLRQCLESIPLKTSRYTIETIVVDNASTDGAPELVETLFPQVKLIRNNENYGFAKANNIGILESKGRYICLVNSDVVILDDCIDKMIMYSDKNPEIGIIGPRILNSDRTLQRTCREYPTLWNTFCRAVALDVIFPKSRVFGGRLMTYWSHDTMKIVEVINGCFWLVKREALEKVGLLDEYFFMYAEDVDWCKRFNDAGWKVLYFPEPQAIHYGGGSSINAPIRYYLEMYRANVKYWKKHHGHQAQVLFVVLTVLHHVIRTCGEAVQYIIAPSKRKQTMNKLKRSIACIQWLLKFDYEKSIS